MNAESWNERYAATDLVWSATPNIFVEQILADATPGRAIDIAAGEGRNAIWLASKGWDVVAVDYSSVGLDKAVQVAERVGVQIETVVADLTDWTPAPGGFDLVLINYLQMDAERLDPILARAADAVAPGGRFLLVCHDAANLERGYGGPPYPEVQTTPEQVVSAIEAQLTVDRAEVAERVVATDEGDRVALDTLVVAHRPIG